MAWQKLTGEAAEIAIWPDGHISWNACAHVMLRDPDFVDLFYDSATNRLGFRRISRNTTCLQVFFDASDYTIASVHHLDSVGISVAALYTAAPHMPTPPPDPPAQPGDMGITWIYLP